MRTTIAGVMIESVLRTVLCTVLNCMEKLLKLLQSPLIQPTKLELHLPRNKEMANQTRLTYKH